jgi:hypothetical protein
MIASFRQVQKSPKGSRVAVLGVAHGTPLRLLFLKERSKLISPTHVVRMNLLQRHELLTCRGCIAPELCQEINNALLLGDLPFRHIQLSNSLHEFVHDGLLAHLSPPAPPDSIEIVVELYGRTA